MRDAAQGGENDDWSDGALCRLWGLVDDSVAAKPVLELGRPNRLELAGVCGGACDRGSSR